MIASLPFTDLNLHAQGVLRLEDEGLVLEWRGFMNWFWGHHLVAQQVHIPVSQLDEIEYSNPFYLFHAKLRIRVRNLQILAGVPGSNGAEVTLYCRKRYRRLAQEIANLATFQRLEQVFPEPGLKQSR